MNESRAKPSAGAAFNFTVARIQWTVKLKPYGKGLLRIG